MIKYIANQYHLNKEEIRVKAASSVMLNELPKND